MTILEISDLVARHGLLEAVRGITLTIKQGETIALVGANGAGKTTLMRALAGAHPTLSGSTRLAGEDITTLKAHQRVRKGLALVPEGRRLFGSMTVAENLTLGAMSGRRGNWSIDRVMSIFPNLEKRLKSKSGTLSGGEQQATAIGRALMTNPDVLLIDEVSLGLSPLIVDRLYASIKTLIGDGTSILLVEQDLKRAMSVSDRIVCMLEGRISLEGNSHDLSRERITEAYFGLSRARHESAKP